MVGVWDTVGSLGIPAAVGIVDPSSTSSCIRLHPDVLNAYHAIAIAEKRAEFPPTLWTGAPAPGQTVEQVWFTGVHSDVGGGEPPDSSGTTALSDITLGWMMAKAVPVGLQLDPQVLAKYSLPLDPKYALDQLHTSWNVLWGVPKMRSIGAGAVLSNSVAFRCANDVSYRPANLVFGNGALFYLWICRHWEWN
jgi:hypothetical protein